ncbi:Peptidase M48, Ste24p [gut metagenome]|uniref:Peptidase M48, Ste24p n=1 Tax=gut metagenome TaxID=749906 RepID=J9GT13_9ZZZZ
MKKKKDENKCGWFSRTQNEKIDTDSRYSPSIALERQIGQQIYTALQGPIVEDVLREIKASNNDAYWRSSMEGHSLKVEKDLLPDFYDLCQQVQSKLGFKEKVDFYITGDSTVNAFSVAAENENEPHIVNVNSALFDLMSHDELKFVIGHELGHLINRDTALVRLIQFVFPPGSEIPVTLQYKIRLHQQLAELVADRYGYMAIENLDVCVTAFFKMASDLIWSR